MERKSFFNSPMFSARSMAVIGVVAALGYLVASATIDNHAHPEEGATPPRAGVDPAETDRRGRGAARRR
ncbi:MAG: hypothetical protein HQK87_08170, partial [Nitrospinae bacterium]|nr:hypothetical protein [Nitrospinota bacterium]